MKQTLALAFLVALSASPAPAQTFRSDDPLRVDNGAAVDVKNIAAYKLSDYYDFFQHSFKKSGDRTSKTAVNINTLGEVPGEAP